MPESLPPEWAAAVRAQSRPPIAPPDLGDTLSASPPAPTPVVNNPDDLVRRELRAVLDKLKQSWRARGITLGGWAEAAGVSRSWVSRMVNGHHPNPTLDTCIRLAGVVGLRIAIVTDRRAAPGLPRARRAATPPAPTPLPPADSYRPRYVRRPGAKED
jgi:transcriptional regulator with XRE-family HTH domain